MPAFLIFTTNGKEIGRRPLDGAAVIGRSPECDIAVRDILLSRLHCRLEPQGSGWVLIDLQSKNGTRIGTRAVTRHRLHDGDVIRIGKTSATFRVGSLAAGATGKVQLNGSRRPADPWEAMAGTVSGFDYAKARMEAKSRAPHTPVIGLSSRFPNPQPSPLEPEAYEREDLYAMLSDIASSSWDSIYANASRPSPARTPPRPMVLNGRHPRRSRSPHVDLSLQVTPGLFATPPTPPPARRPHWRSALAWMTKGFCAVGQMVMVYGVADALR